MRGHPSQHVTVTTTKRLTNRERAYEANIEKSCSFYEVQRSGPCVKLKGGGIQRRRSSLVNSLPLGKRHTIVCSFVTATVHTLCVCVHTIIL